MPPPVESERSGNFAGEGTGGTLYTSTHCIRPRDNYRNYVLLRAAGSPQLRLQLEAQQMGPFLFKLSRRSIVVVMLTAAVIGWLALRHAPWRSVGEIQTVPRGAYASPAFVPACNGMLAPIPSRGIYLIDLATARPIRRVGDESDGSDQFQGTQAGQRVFVFRPGGPTIKLYDSFTGTRHPERSKASGRS